SPGPPGTPARAAACPVRSPPARRRPPRTPPGRGATAPRARGRTLSRSGGGRRAPRDALPTATRAAPRRRSSPAGRCRPARPRGPAPKASVACRARAQPTHRISPEMPASPIAVVDIGTNSTRLLIGRVDDGRVEEVERESKVTRLGQGVDSTGRLADEA